MFFLPTKLAKEQETKFCHTELGTCNGRQKCSVRHLVVKLVFERFGHIFPPSPQNGDFSISSTAQTTAPGNIELGAGGMRELTLDANKIEQMLKYRKASFPEKCPNCFCRSLWVQVRMSVSR